MRLALPFAGALVVLLSSSVASMALRSDLAKRLQLAAELGLDSKSAVKDGQAFRTAATQDEIPVEYASV